VWVFNEYFYFTLTSLYQSARLGGVKLGFIYGNSKEAWCWNKKSPSKKGEDFKKYSRRVPIAIGMNPHVH